MELMRFINIGFGSGNEVLFHFLCHNWVDNINPDHMSLFIIGSCCRVTQNIIKQLAQRSQYSKITICDLLPVYSFHQRYYRLRQSLKPQLNSLDLSLEKLFEPACIQEGVKTHDDILFVTHDYYQNVTSKTKLMRLTAQLANKKDNVYFATPMEYDHYGNPNPEQNYNEAEKDVRESLPNSTIIRSAIQDSTEFHAATQGLDHPAFRPKVVSATNYAALVADTMKHRVRGKALFVQSESDQDRGLKDWVRNGDIQKDQYMHAKANAKNIVQKYKLSVSKNAEVVAL